ncbi:MAG TPA: LuxR C-terminal-related transcriptional regulator [Ktedonobacteraceae bacterium]|jgi:DNA-binding NarL/FixJ family response regulator
MGYHLLLAEPCEILRVGLKTAFLGDSRVTQVYEAATSTSLKAQLHLRTLDLVIANQQLVPDITILPKKGCVLLASEPDLDIIKAAYQHGICGYLSERVSVNLLKIILEIPEGSFFLEPSLVPQVMECLAGGVFSAIKEERLTPREKEIIGLLKEGVDRRTIARRLCITDATLKTHIKNMRKHGLSQSV